MDCPVWGHIVVREDSEHITVVKVCCIVKHIPLFFLAPAFV